VGDRRVGDSRLEADDRDRRFLLCRFLEGVDGEKCDESVELSDESVFSPEEDLRRGKSPSSSSLEVVVTVGWLE
jgi:hypothetical protein